MTEQHETVYPIFHLHGLHWRLIGIYLSEESGRAALDTIPPPSGDPRGPDESYILQAWPAGQLSLAFVDGRRLLRPRDEFGSRTLARVEAPE